MKELEIAHTIHKVRYTFITKMDNPCTNTRSLKRIVGDSLETYVQKKAPFQTLFL